MSFFLSLSLPLRKNLFTYSKTIRDYNLTWEFISLGSCSLVPFSMFHISKLYRSIPKIHSLKHFFLMIVFFSLVEAAFAPVVFSPQLYSFCTDVLMLFVIWLILFVFLYLLVVFFYSSIMTHCISSELTFLFSTLNHFSFFLSFLILDL